jgi:hypothetical protein
VEPSDKARAIALKSSFFVEDTSGLESHLWRDYYVACFRTRPNLDKQKRIDC